MVQRLEVQDGSLIVLNSEIANVELFGCACDIRQKLAVGPPRKGWSEQMVDTLWPAFERRDR